MLKQPISINIRPVAGSPVTGEGSGYTGSINNPNAPQGKQSYSVQATSLDGIKALLISEINGITDAPVVAAPVAKVEAHVEQAQAS